jgi:hypothetical protein
MVTMPVRDDRPGFWLGRVDEHIDRTDTKVAVEEGLRHATI